MTVIRNKIFEGGEEEGEDEPAEGEKEDHDYKDDIYPQTFDSKLPYNWAQQVPMPSNQTPFWREIKISKMK
jgi:hypothetical protein